jgi:hypothetical protein
MKSSSNPVWFSWIFALTILLSAFLLFEVQPILSKFILPWFGGTPAVWTTCMVFFQTVLFLGYAYAHLSQKILKPRAQALVHLLILVAAVSTLHIAPDISWKLHGSESPVLSILLLLTACVGLPYFAVATTGPLVQAWFSRAYPHRSPYRLYALSNFGSLAALLSYPFVVEPALRIGTQTNYWAWGFVAFATLCAASAIITGWLVRHPSAVVKSDDLQSSAPAEPPPTLGCRLLWLLLPGLASMMLLATTNHVCQDVAVIPFLWVMPLSLYLLTFIICFDHERWYKRRIMALGAIVTLCLVTAVDQLITTGANVSFSFSVELALYFAALFFLCTVCHGELVRLKPAPRYLTSFYLHIAAGGALGGLFVSLAAPHLFSTFMEWKIGLVGGCVVAAAVVLGSRSAASLRRLYYLAPALALLFVGFKFLPPFQSNKGTELDISSRTFYGVTRIVERDSDDPQQHKLQIYSGRIVHGLQFFDEHKRLEPNAYYGRETGGGQAFEFFGSRPDLRVGVIGLGAGTLAAYAKAGQHIRFYEINPDMLHLANQYFSYLKDCHGQVDIVLGDGRLSLERETVPGSSEPPFDLLVLDAFSGDSIPAHLLTKEAFKIYLQRLKPEGAIAVHISNRYLDLAPVVCGVGHEFGMTALKFSSPGDAEQGKFPAQWIVLTKNPNLCDKYPEAAEAANDVRQLRRGFWTDDCSNLFEILK